MKKVFNFLVISMLVFGLVGCSGNVLTSKSNSTVGASYDNDESTTLPSSTVPEPEILSTAITSTDGDSDSWYEDTDTVTIAIEFSEIVDVNVTGGVPSIPVTMSSGLKTATYATGTGTNTLNFNLLITKGDEQCDGVLALGALALNGGTIQDLMGNNSINASLASSVTGAQVDTVSPSFSGAIDVSAHDSFLNELSEIAAVTATWSSVESCSHTTEMAIGEHDGATCALPISVSGFEDIGAVSTYQPISGASPFGVLSLNVSPDSQYCTTVKVTDAAGNEVLQSSSAWQTAYEYSDETFEPNCNKYVEDSRYNSVGDGLYRIDPDGLGGNPEFLAYCDMTTDSGGWTLVGRGRENWSWLDAGENNTIVHTQLAKPAGFVPAYYSSALVNELVEDVDFSTLTDGLRIKRASNTTGTIYQEVRWKFAASEPVFSWTFDSTLQLSDHIVDGASFGARHTRDAIPSNNHTRIFTWAWTGKGSIRGFCYGNSVEGINNNDPNTFMWERTSERHATPYTEVYVRE